MSIRSIESEIAIIARSGVSYEYVERQFRKVFLIAALTDNRWNVCKTARRIGMHRNTLSRQMEKLQIVRPQASRKQPQDEYVYLPAEATA